MRRPGGWSCPAILAPWQRIPKATLLPNRECSVPRFLDRCPKKLKRCTISGAVMFEIGIFGVILLAVGYSVILWIMARRDDVLHGQFVESQAEPVSVPAPPPARPRASPESLRSLLASIERELKNVAQL
jgi:hypothetical protein